MPRLPGDFLSLSFSLSLGERRTQILLRVARYIQGGALNSHFSLERYCPSAKKLLRPRAARVNVCKAETEQSYSLVRDRLQVAGEIYWHFSLSLSLPPSLFERARAFIASKIINAQRAVFFLPFFISCEYDVCISRVVASFLIPGGNIDVSKYVRACELRTNSLLPR